LIKERTQNMTPTIPRLTPFIILTTWFYFIFVDFGVYRVESIGYLIKWNEWMKTLKPLANKDHWENWKIKSIHPTSILDLRFDDQLIGWYFWYFRVNGLLFIMRFIILQIGEMINWRLFYFYWQKEQKWMFKTQ